MTQCKQCSSPLTPGRKVFCSEQCSWRWQNAKRSTGPMPSKTEQVETPQIHQTAQRLIVSGHLPSPYQIDPHDQRPLWDFVGLAELLNQRPDQLAQLLLANGPAYLPGAGIPSSWQLLREV